MKVVVSEQCAPSVQQGREIADLLRASFPSIGAILLCGSVARGDSDAFSDLDLVVIGSDRRLSSERLLKCVTDIEQRASVMYYTSREFRRRLHARVLFAIHLRKEGIVLFDRAGIQEALAKSSISPADIDEQVKVEASKLSVYDDSSRFNNNFLFCLSHLYSIGKAVVMLQLARAGRPEFNRDAAFEHFAAANPEFATETQQIARLRPFYKLVNARQPEPLPFSYKSAGREMQEAVKAIQKLANCCGR